MIRPGESILPDAIVDALNGMVAHAKAVERNNDAARRELEHVLSLLPFEHAKTGKYRKLRRRLERFLSERIDGL